MNMIIKGGIVVSDKVYHDGAVVVEDKYIVDVGYRDEILHRYSSSGYEVIDARDKIIIPGIINTHTHISMTLLRGYADDLELQEWLEKKIWPIEAKLTDRDIELGAELGAVESIQYGVTTICSMYHYYSDHNEATGTAKVGLRTVMATAIFYWKPEESLKKFRDAVMRWHGSFNGLVRIAAGPHAPYTVSPELWRETIAVWRELREKFNDRGRIIITAHILEDWNEYKLVRERFNVELPDGSMYKYLEDLGVLSDDFLAAHSIHMNEVDYIVASRNKINISHNPIANLKLAMGIADVVKMLRYGINVSLGTDGPASNNTVDMFETMKVTALIHKEVNRDPTALPAKTVFKLATENAAKALGFNNLGAIRKGYLADIVLINRRRPNLKPLYDVYSHLIYAIRASSDVDTVIINGDIVMENKEFKNINIGELYDRVDRRARELEEIGREAREGRP